MFTFDRNFKELNLITVFSKDVVRRLKSFQDSGKLRVVWKHYIVVRTY